MCAIRQHDGQTKAGKGERLGKGRSRGGPGAAVAGGIDYQTTNRQKSGSCSSIGDSLKANLAKSTAAATQQERKLQLQYTRAKQIQIKLNNNNCDGQEHKWLELDDTRC